MKTAPTNSSIQHRLAVDVPGLASLGAEGVEVLLGEGPPPCDADRVERVGGGAGWSAHRYPLPGTPHRDGRFREPPKGAGTGWVRWWRFGPGGPAEWRACLRARFTAPVSQGRASRLWNLLCRLQGEGVPVPAPLAVGERGRGIVARRGFLIVRELVGHCDLGTFLSTKQGSPASESNPGSRRRVAEALGRALSALFSAGLRGAEFGPGSFHVRDVGGDACGGESACDGGAESGASCQDASDPNGGEGRTGNSLEGVPGVESGMVLRARARAVLADPLALESARFGEVPGPEARIAILGAWSSTLSCDGVEPGARFLLRVARHALGPGVPKEVRRRCLAGLGRASARP